MRTPWGHFGDELEPPRDYHDVAQICLNGHVINSSSQTYPQFNKKFCDKCGAETINACPSCQKPIRGKYHSRGVISVGGLPTPPFCAECGKAFPWTEARLSAAREIADELEVSDDDKEKLKGSLDDLVRESPKTEVAKLKFKNVMRKAGSASLDIMKDTLSDVLSEVVKKSLFGP